MRTTVTLDEDVYEAAMHLSRTSGQRFGVVLSALARKGLTREAGAKPKKGRFPAFKVPGDAAVIPAARVTRFLEEEGAL